VVYSLPGDDGIKDKLTLEIEKGEDDNNSRVGVSVRVDITEGEGSKLSGSALLIPKCSSYKVFEEEFTRIKEELDTLLERSKKIFGAEDGEEDDWEVNENTGAKEIWDILSKIKDPGLLSVKFNTLSHQKRLEVADYVLTNCNVFSGPASIFSMRYNSEEGVLE